MANSHNIMHSIDIEKKPAIEAIDRNFDHLADFLCPPAEWAVKFREKRFLTDGTFEKATNDSSSDSNKKKATLMIGDIQRCIRVDDPNSFRVLVNMIKQDTHGNSLAKKLISEPIRSFLMKMADRFVWKTGYITCRVVCYLSVMWDV